MISHVIGTAGHIDHGKTTLVRALTGHDTDRLKEERERKISIDLGFAPLTLPSGMRVAVVDVPGHERFVKNMLAGVGGIDAVLFTVAADEGVMPQTAEHLEILNFLGVETGVVALTKSDLVDEEMLELAADDVTTAFAETTLRDAPVIPCSGETGDGVPLVLAALEKVLRQAPPRRTADWFRLPVDRVFSSRGFGTVVTGTVWSGDVKVGDRLSLLPGGSDVRVRKVEVFHEEVPSAGSGQRTALALHGVSCEEVTRGNLLATPGVLTATHMVDARLRLSRSAKPLTPRKRIRFHHGASEILGRVVLLDTIEIEPGGEGLVQFRLESPVAVAAGDRLIVRSYSPARTIAGGRVIDALPPKRKSRRPSDLAFLGVLEKGDRRNAVKEVLLASRSAGSDVVALAKRLQETPGAMRALLEEMESDGVLRFIGSSAVLVETMTALRAEVGARLERALREDPLNPGLPREDVRKGLSREVDLSLFSELLRMMSSAGEISVQGDLLLHGAGGLPAEAEKAAGAIDALLEEKRFVAPSMEEIAAVSGIEGKSLTKTIDLLVRLGKVVKITPSLVYRKEEIAEMAEMVRQRLARDGFLDIAAFRELTGLSRKYSVPILEYFDREGITRREGDRRLPGRTAASTEERD